MALRWRSLRSGDLLRFIIVYGRRISISETQPRRRSSLCRSLLYCGLSAQAHWRCALSSALVTKTAVLHGRSLLFPSVLGSESRKSRRRSFLRRPDCATVASHMLLHICHLLALGGSLHPVRIYSSLYGIPLLLHHHRNDGRNISPAVFEQRSPDWPRA